MRSSKEFANGERGNADLENSLTRSGDEALKCRNITKKKLISTHFQQQNMRLYYDQTMHSRQSSKIKYNKYILGKFSIDVQF